MNRLELSGYVTTRVKSSIVYWLATWLFSLSALAQSSGAEPAVLSKQLAPFPLQKVGSVFSMSFVIGNNGASAPINGSSDEERMGFTIDFKQCVPAPASEQAFSGTVLNWFDVRYNAAQNRLEARQKAGVSLEAETVGQLIITAVVTQATSMTDVNAIGALCTILPNASAQPAQSTDDDQLSIYTHTIELAKPGSLEGFSAQDQPGRTVKLRWITGLSLSVKAFIIERSKDQKAYEVVTQITDPAVSTALLRLYRYIDKNPYRGRSYYRLRQLNSDGSEQTYPAEWVIVEGQYGLTARPAVGTPFTVGMDDPAQAVLHLYSERGEEIGLVKSDIAESSLTLTPAIKLERGVYYLTVEERATKRRHRFVVR